MMLIGCDFHPSWQQVSWLDVETGGTGEQKLVHARGEAKQFYEQLAAPVLIGMEATGNSQWFIELVEELGHEIWIGDAAQIRASYVRKQKTDKRDAAHILKLLVEGRFPRLGTPDREQRDLRQLVLHWHKLVLIRSRVKNELQHLCLNKGVQRKRMLRMLLVEAAQAAVRYDPQFRKEYLHRCHQKPKAVAKVAAARKLAVRLYWMLRTQQPYPAVVRIESSPRVPLVGAS